MNLDEIWEILITTRESQEIVKLPEPISIPNSFSHKDYLLTHRFLNSKSAFIGEDHSKQKFHIKVFGVPSFDQVKSVHQTLKRLKAHAEELKLIEVIDIVEFFESDRWVMLLVTPYYEGFTLEELTEMLNSNNFHLTKDESIAIFIEILNIIKAADSFYLVVNTMPDNLFFMKSSNNGILRTENSVFELKILATSLELLRCGKSKLERIYPNQKKRINSEGMIWGAGLSLYALVSSEKISMLPPLSEVKDGEKAEFLKYFYKDEAMSYIILRSLKNTKFEIFMSHPFIICWRALMEENWDKVSGIDGKQNLSALLSGLTFSRKSCRMLAMRKILLVAQESSTEVCSSLSKNELIYVFVDIALYFDWSLYPELINSVLLVLKDKLVSRSFKEKLVSMSFFTLLSTAIDLRSNTDILCDFILKFFEDTTLTILQIVYTKGFLHYLIEKQNKSITEITFIKFTMSYYGPNSVELIKKVYETIEITEILVNKHLLEIPYYFKLEKSQMLVPLMQRILERNARTQGDAVLDMLKTIVLILAEILCVPKMFQYHHTISLCTSESKKLFLKDLGRNPLLIKCKVCGHSYCAMCKAKRHESHDYQYVLYQNPLHRCNTSIVEELRLDYDLELFQLPKYQSKISFIDSIGGTYKSSNAHIRGSGYLKISTREALVCQPPSSEKGTVAYFEIKVNEAGMQENIEIGIEGSGVSYRSIDGGIYFNGNFVSKGPRFGSYDTVGIGVTSAKKAYITYNGLVNWPMVDCELASELRPLIILNSEQCDIEVQIRTFVFQPTREQSENQDFVNNEVLMISDKLLETLCKHVKKCYSKNSKDPKAQDLLDKYIEILKAVKKGKLVEKLEVKKKWAWSRQ